MEIDAQLAFGGEPFHRFAFPYRRIAVDVVAHLRRQHEEPAVDPAAVAERLFLKAGDAIAVVPQRAETAGRLRGGHGCQAVLGDAMRSLW